MKSSLNFRKEKLLNGYFSIMLLQKALLIFIYLTEVNSLRNYRKDKGPCFTSRNESGTCIVINECQYMLDILKNVNKNMDRSDSLHYLRMSTCGFNGTEPKVCCPTATARTSLISTLPTPPNCGVSQSMELSKIVGGGPAMPGQFPWIAAIGYKSKLRQHKIVWLCGGCLITERYVLTAAHCVIDRKQPPSLVRVGDINLDENVNDGASPQERKVQQIVYHNNYNQNFENDIALLKLDEPIILNKMVQPICLPKSPALRANSFITNTPFAAGWGKTLFKGESAAQLQMVILPVVDNTLCWQAYQEKKLNISKNQLCAGYFSGEADTCQGDSGGPLMQPKSGYFYQIGIVSFGYKCAEKGYPGVYTRVTEYIDWISQTIN